MKTLKLKNLAALAKDRRLRVVCKKDGKSYLDAKKSILNGELIFSHTDLVFMDDAEFLARFPKKQNVSDAPPSECETANDCVVEAEAIFERL